MRNASFDIISIKKEFEALGIRATIRFGTISEQFNNGIRYVITFNRTKDRNFWKLTSNWNNTQFIKLEIGRKYG